MLDGETVVAIMVGQDVIGHSPNAASTSSQSSDQNFIAACREMVPKLLAERKAISDLVGGDPSVLLVERVACIRKELDAAKKSLENLIQFHESIVREKDERVRRALAACVPANPVAHCVPDRKDG